jgi:hypothetical protein
MKWSYVSKTTEKGTIHIQKPENDQPFIAIKQASV